MFVRIDQRFVDQTTNELRKYGKSGFEGLVLWIGEHKGDSVEVTQVFVPPQTPIKSEAGVGYLVSGDTLFELNKVLNATGLRLISQVHSHPGRAYHSEMDDRFAIITKEGFFSVVVPNFAEGNADIKCWAIYQLRGGKWEEVSEEEMSVLFKVEGNTSVGPATLKKKWWEVW
jgi:hypothetical protein